MLIQSKVVPMIAGHGDVKSLNDNDDEETLKRFLRTLEKKDVEQLQTGTIEEVPYNGEVGIIHYLPHHEVWNPNKSTTKLRIVYDASSHQKNHGSIYKQHRQGAMENPYIRMKEIPRFITMNTESIELHIFTDASKLAYAAALIYR
ncbi:hypothetical protein DINM_000276 [Dirofilaria immitis]|nr:hypothetical protein [Dirofilaria immitis]